MDARTGYTDGMTQREAQARGGALVRAVAYVRVSSEEQRRHGYSLDDQERELRIQIGLKGWELEEVVRDEGISGADPTRPGLRRIEELAREGRCDVALATKRNRFFRDIEHRRRYQRGLRRLGSRIAALNDTGNFIADGVDDLLGEEQRREIARESRRGRRARARKGEVVAGVAPFGFRFTPDRKNFEVEEQEAVVVRRIFALAASGTGLNGVKNALQARACPHREASEARRARATGRPGAALCSGRWSFLSATFPTQARSSPRLPRRATSMSPWRPRPPTLRASGGSPVAGSRRSTTRRRASAGSSGTTPRRSTSPSRYRTWACHASTP